MRKRNLLCLILFVLILLLGGCAKKVKPVALTDPKPGTENESSGLCPWDYNVCAVSVRSGTLDYYFMSSEGQIACEDLSESTKWGDCCLVVFPNGQTMLVDCGVVDFGPILVENLNRMGVKKLDYVVITHPHTDHQDGIFHADNLSGEGVLDCFEIGQVYYRGGNDPDRVDSQYVEWACAERNIPLDVLEMGDVIQIGQVHARVLWPVSGTSEKQITGTANVNNSGIVIRFDYGKHASLFAADLYDDGEYAMLSAQETAFFDVDLLKAPHHGSHTSGSAVFLNIASPELTVATGYMPIRDDVLRRYAACKTLILSDWVNGYIHVFTDGNTMTWETSRQEPLPTNQCIDSD